MFYLQGLIKVYHALIWGGGGYMETVINHLAQILLSIQ